MKRTIFASFAKLIITAISIVLIVLLAACGTNAELTRADTLFVSEALENVEIPEEYTHYLNMLNADDEYLYCCYRGESDRENAPLRLFKLHRKTGAITEFPTIKGGVLKYARGYHGKMYIGLINIENAVYEVTELSDNNKKVIYKRRNDDIPQVTGSQNKHIMVISHVNKNGVEVQSLEVLDLTTRMTKVIDRARNTPSKRIEGMMDGTLFMGFDYMFESASSEGFCYEKCKYDGANENTEYGGKNKAYFYSFTTGKKTRLENPVGTLEYINGSPELYLSSTFSGGINTDGSENEYDDYGEADMFIREKEKYRRVNLNKMLEDAGAEAGTSGTMRCGGMIGKDAVFFGNAEVEGFFVIDVNSLEYFYESFQDSYEDTGKTSYQEFLGDSYDNVDRTYSFLTRSKKNGKHEYVLHTLSEK